MSTLFFRMKRKISLFTVLSMLAMLFLPNGNAYAAVSPIAKVLDTSNFSNQLKVNGGGSVSPDGIGFSSTSASSAFTNNPITLGGNRAFSTFAKVESTAELIGSNYFLDDSFAMVLQTSGNDSLPPYSSPLGINDSISVLVNTNSNSIALIQNAGLILGTGAISMYPGSSGSTSDPGTMNLYLWMDYDGVTLEVRASSSNVRPTGATVSAAVDLSTVALNLSNRVYAGFTGSKNTHGVNVVKSFYIDNVYDPLTPATVTYQSSGVAGVTSVMVPPNPANGYYTAGENLDFTVSFDRLVNVETSSGTPSLVLIVGGTVRNAAYQSGSGTNALSFRYTVQSNDIELNGIGVGINISLNNGSIYDGAGNNASDNLQNLANTSGILIYNVPVAPTNVSAMPGNGKAVVSFAPSAGGAIAEYKVVSSPGGLTATGKSSPLTVSGLTNGTAYTFTVTATDEQGVFKVSAASPGVTPATVPDAPENVSATAGNGEAVVSFAAPVSNGGNAITGYAVTSSPGSVKATGSDSPITVTGLTNGTAYTFTVTAMNGEGTSAASAASPSVTPVTVPDAPENVSATAGNGEAVVSFAAPVSNGGSAITGYAVTSSPGSLTATGTDSPITVTGLTNGTAYTFTVTAMNGEGTSAASAASPSVTPVSTIANLDGLSLSSGVLDTAFNSDMTSYTASVINSVSAVAVTATVSDSNASVKASLYSGTGTLVSGPISLENGKASPSLPLIVGRNKIVLTVTAQDGTTTKTYTVTVTKAPAAPTGLMATAENGKVRLNWTDTQQGGVTYTVYQGTNSGSYNSAPVATVNGTANTYTVSDLTNGKTYYFIVKASNEGEESSSSNEVSATPHAASSASSPNDSDSNANDDVTGNNQATPISFKMMINGVQYEGIVTGATTKENGRIALTMTVDSVKLASMLAKEGEKPNIVFLVGSGVDKTTLVLTGDTVKGMENKQAVVEVQTPNGNYKLPALEIGIDRLSSQLGDQVKLADFVVHIDIAKSDDAKVKLLDKGIETGKYSVVVPPVDFTVAAVYNAKTVDVDKFSSYVEREIPLPVGIEPSKVTTAVVLESDGTIHHAATSITVRDGKYYAVVNSLTNSTYALIGHQIMFADVEGYWFKDAVNDMASRMIVNGADETHFQPNAAITRAEFAAIIIRALGLADNGATTVFGDVKSGDWYAGAVAKAQEYGIIEGYGDQTFAPSKTITREEAMVIIAKAMKLAALETTINDAEADAVLSKFADGLAVDAWAKQEVAATVNSGLIRGSEAGLLPTSDITRAETAAIVQRMLIKASLIDNRDLK